MVASPSISFLAAAASSLFPAASSPYARALLLLKHPGRPCPLADFSSAVAASRHVGLGNRFFSSPRNPSSASPTTVSDRLTPSASLMAVSPLVARWRASTYSCPSAQSSPLAAASFPVSLRALMAPSVVSAAANNHHRRRRLLASPPSSLLLTTCHCGDSPSHPR
eukprot:CAMPEP_0117459560 /NCGR_PEP_ID=MMETSP0784-20121206/1545_1 /TAXON_ID=39447 /ORGANISM="" /LENGTH=164 /DNA_ID=CAMNT_0005253185 /DNA_START=167 /DNA_END=662 /DNA_ORIENTATION=+